jgi:cytochrome c biogenesis protein CcmG, thiol:disulfide interchange protein DsbE
MRAAMILLAVATVLLVIDVVVTQLPASPRAPAVQSGAIAPSQLAVGTAVDEKAPDVTLRDDGGRPTPLASFRGRYLVLAPAMTLCHEVCPMTTAALGQLQAAVRREGLARDVAVAEVSVDPWRDTPARLRAYRRLTGTGIDLLTGAPDQLRRLWRFLGVYYKRVPQGHPPDVDWLTGRPERFDVQHADGLFIVDPAGHWRMGTVGMPSVGGRIAPPLRRLLNDQGRSNLRRPRAPWTPEQALADLVALKQRDDAAAGARPPAPTPAPAPSGAQSGVLLGGGASALSARLRSLRGRPVVLNEWASWCFPCRDEFPLFAQASARYGKRVAFLGVDVSDAAGDARAFLRSHPVSYPSYADSGAASASAFGTTAGLPTTVYLGADGRRLHTHTGQYAAPQALDADIERYALGT